MHAQDKPRASCTRVEAKIDIPHTYLVLCKIVAQEKMLNDFLSLLNYGRGCNTSHRLSIKAAKRFFKESGSNDCAHKSRYFDFNDTILSIILVAAFSGNSHSFAKIKKSFFRRFRFFPFMVKANSSLSFSIKIFTGSKS